MANRMIFLIDDDPDDKEIFITAIHEIDPSVKCDTASNGKEALERILANEINADLVLLDLNMPLMNGKEFLREINNRRLLARVPVIVFTTSSDPATLQEVRQLGASDSLTKPENYTKLVTTLRSVLKHQGK